MSNSAKRTAPRSASGQAGTRADYWRAVTEYDASYDGQFVYAVFSSGTYCRPSCPSERPHRHDVEFFPLPEAAESAGFRPCSDCNPHATRAVDPQVALIRRACQYIREYLDDSPTLPDIGAHVGMSPYHLQRVFKKYMGISPRQYAEATRLNLLKARLREGDSVTGALYDAGYSSSSRLYERANTHLGMTPATYRRGGEGMHIRYTLCDCVLGRLLVAITEKGVCAIHLGRDDAELIATLMNEYSGATFQQDQLALCQWVDTLLSYISGWQPHLDLPLDIQATAFQWRVWNQLQQIPAGETRTFREIAAAIGQPNAASAVARAIAENPVAIAIPCHRAETTDGGTSSFYSVRALEGRRKLLAHEQHHEQHLDEHHDQHHDHGMDPQPVLEAMGD